MKPRTSIQLDVLYLFAGQARKVDLKQCLAALVAEYNACASFEFNISFAIEEVDLLRGGPSHDLLSPMKRRHYMGKAAVVDVAAVTPPCNTHTRSRHSGFPGPPPVRDASFP